MDKFLIKMNTDTNQDNMNNVKKNESVNSNEIIITTQIYNEDCLSVFERIDSSSINLILTDPPYGTTANKWDSVIDVKKMWIHIKRVLKDNGIVILFGKEPFLSTVVVENLQGFWQELIWEKNVATGFLNSKIMHLDNHEKIYVFRNVLKKKQQYTYNPQMSVGKPYHVKISNVRRGNYQEANTVTEHINEGTRCPQTILKFDRVVSEERVHPTQKPIDLLSYLIKTYSNEGDVVLDFAMGSGSTGVACKLCKRSFIGIELNNDIFEYAQKRLAMTHEKWREFVKQKRYEERTERDNRKKIKNNED